VELQDLKVFLAVAEELHFGRAAARLHMAQPPVSRTIKSLESELGTDLFQRTTRFVTLTPAGEVLKPAAARILAAVQRAVADVASVSRGDAGRLEIAFAGASTHVMVGRLARAARSRYPDLRLELSSQNFAGPAMSRVLRDEVDIAIGRWDYIPAGIHSRILANEQLVLALPASHPFAGAASASISSFADEAFVSLPPHPGSVLTDRLSRLCHAAGFEPNIVQLAPDSWTAMSLVAAEVGVMLTISTVAANAAREPISFVPVSDPIEQVQLRMAWRADSRNPALGTILRLAKEILPTAS